MAIKIAGVSVINDLREIENLGAPLTTNQGGTGELSFINGQLLIGNSNGSTLTKAFLTAGNNILITNGPGSITISSSNANLSVTNGTSLGPVINSSTGTSATIPSASENNSGIVTTGAQTFAGVKTFSSGIVAPITGNSSTATKLATARKINNVNFDGSADITIVDTTKLPLTGGTVTGDINIINSTNEMHIRLGSNGGYFYGTGTNVGFFKSSGASISINVASGDLSTNGSISATKCNISGLSLGSIISSSETDISNHISLWGTTYGLSVSSNTLNVISESGNGNIKLHGHTNITGLMSTRCNTSTSFVSSNDITLSIRGSTLYPAVMSFNRIGAFAVNFGLDTDNVMKLGGWSATSVKHSWKSNGDYLAVGNITAYYSDERLKNFHGKIINAIDKICSLNGYYFTENQIAKDLGYNNDRMQVGLSAQEVENVLPEIVTKAPLDGDHDYKTIWYDKLIPLLIEAIKEQQLQINQLKAFLDS